MAAVRAHLEYVRKGDERMLEEGMEIRETESSINLEELISKYVFESGRK